MATRADAASAHSDAEQYKYLERRPESWRRQLFLKGRNMTVGHLVYGMRANRLIPEEAAENYDLPLEQVQEALLYYERHSDLIEQDVEDERRQIEALATHRGPTALSR